MNLFSAYKQLEEYVNTPTIFNLEPYKKIVKSINERFNEIKDLNQNAILLLHQKLRSEIIGDTANEEQVINGFAIIKRLAEIFLGLTPYDVQLITGLVLFEGRLAEMKTGEGKTLAALFPTYLRALEGKGIHVHSFNDYLSNRDYLYFKPLFDFLSITSGCIHKDMDLNERLQMLSQDVTYGSSKQFIYTYLKQSINENYSDIEKYYQYAIVDEADAILLDEATNPFVIAGHNKVFDTDFYKISKAIKILIKSDLYEYGKNQRNVYLKDEGVSFIQNALGIDNLFEEEHHDTLSAINLSLHAHVLLEKDVDYIVKDEEVLLVDEFTGRIIKDRKWRNGLQSAVEAKEMLPIKSEGSILNSITIPNFFKLYHLKSAMTATARESSNEFMDNYALELVIIPPNIPSRRIDLPTRIFRTKGQKYKAIIEKIRELHESKIPVLIGTQHIMESELIFNQLKVRGIKCQILNAKNDAEEASIIAGAGKLGSVIISTNMAGRGTDIKLGGEQREAYEKVEELGGLFVIGTNMHKSGRIDRQLRGRAGRQGEKGASQFFISLEDELFEKFELEKILAKKFKNETEPEIMEPAIMKYINHTQEVAEDQDNLLRTTINQYSEINAYQYQLILQQKQNINKDDLPLNLKKLLGDYLDKEWSEHLNQLFEAKDGIQFISLGGQNPLRAYRQLAHELFQKLETDLTENLEKIKALFMDDPDKIEELNLRYRRPSSTWTYTVNDKAFNSGIIGLMKGSGNIAFQIDFTGLFILFFKYLGMKAKNIFRNNKNKKSG